jgi:serine/threonine protein kinase
MWLFAIRGKRRRSNAGVFKRGSWVSLINYYRDIIFPQFVRDRDFKNLITQMLAKNPLCRLTKLSNIKANAWFSGFSWENLLSLDMEAPYTPKVESKEWGEIKSSTPFLTHVKVICELTLGT